MRTRTREIIDRILYSEVELDDLTSALDTSGLDTNLDTEPAIPIKKEKIETPPPDIHNTDFDLNISDDMTDLDNHTASMDSTDLDFEDVGDIGELDMDELEDTDTGVTEDIGDASNIDDLDGMIGDLNTEIGGDDVDGEEQPVDENGVPIDDDLSLADTEDGEEDSPVSALSPEEELARKKRFIGIIKKLYGIYGDKIARFDTIQMPLDKERIYKPILDKYTTVYDLLREYILTKMKIDDSFLLMKRIVDFNTLFTILEHKLSIVNKWVKEMGK